MNNKLLQCLTKVWIYLLVFSCTQPNDPFKPEINDWLHYQTSYFKMKNKDFVILYKFTFRFQKSPRKNIFFLEVNSFDEKRKVENEKYELHQTQIFGSFKLENSFLELSYEDSVANHKYCDWTLSNIGMKETIKFQYDKKKDLFYSKIFDEKLNFYQKKKAPVEKKYKNHIGVYDEKDCDFFKKNLGVNKGFFSHLK